MAPQITTPAPCSSSLSAVSRGEAPCRQISFLAVSFSPCSSTRRRLLAKSSVVLTHLRHTAMATRRIRLMYCKMPAKSFKVRRFFIYFWRKELNEAVFLDITERCIRATRP